MNRFSLIHAFALLFCWLTIAQQTKSVLFVGNSYTAGNNLADIVSDIATAEGNELIYEVHTLGGQRFMHHAVNLELAQKINSHDWDYVSLQGQSVEVALTGTIFDTEVAPFAAQLVDKIRLSNSCSQPVFFRTWGRENGFSSPDCDEFPWMCTYEGMDDELAQNYQILAEQNNTLISPVGDVWRYLRIHHPDLQLYTGDGSHPSQIGSYAAAVTFYTIFFNTDPINLTFNYTLSNTDADIIKNAVSIVLFETSNDFDFTAFFSETISSNTVTFGYTNLDADGLLWDFGDGSGSTLQQPTHSYSEYGAYQVSLTVNRCGRFHTYSRLIQVSGLSVEEFLLDSFTIYPNPTSGIIHIDNMGNLALNFEVYDSLGKLVVSKQGVSEVITMSELPSGIYFLKFSNQKSVKTIKLIKR